MKGLRAFELVVSILLLVIAAPPASFAGQEGNPKAGKKTYDLMCARCHGSAGKGDGPVSRALPTKPGSLANGQHMKTLTDEYLFTVIKEGGASVGKSPLMPAWGGLSDQDVWNVVAYIRSLAKSGE